MQESPEKELEHLSKIAFELGKKPTYMSKLARDGLITAKKTGK